MVYENDLSKAKEWEAVLPAANYVVLAGRLAAWFLQFFEFLLQLAIPFLAVFADKRLFQKLMNVNFKLSAKRTSRAANTPAVVVQHVKFGIFCDANRV